MDLISPILLVGSLALTAHALFSLYLLLYSWEYPERLEASRGPATQREPSVGFSILLPARNEERVIGGTIKRIWAARYPRKLLQILVICHEDDIGTIKEVRRAIRQIGSRRVRLVTFSGEPVNKPRALNVGLAQAAHEVIAVFDAEDDVDPDVFSIVNTVMLEEKTGVVLSGVQLMNFTDHWFSVHNCLEYYFWFKSRLHFHAKVGMIPLGGNTIFMRRDLIDRVGGWDANCLTEDADIGLRLSTLGEPIRVIYDAQHVTREETPSSVESLVRQRTRWNQGFMHVLRKGSWLELPTWQQRALAIYTFSYPFVQAPITLIWPLAILAGLFLKVPVPVAMASFLPLYAMLFQLALMVVGACMFAREYGLRVPRAMPMKVALTFMPYQLILGFSAARAAIRELQHEGNWEKTEHVGAHRRISLPGPRPLKPVRWGFAQVRPWLGATRGWRVSRGRLLSGVQQELWKAARSALRTYGQRTRGLASTMRMSVGRALPQVWSDVVLLTAGIGERIHRALSSRSTRMRGVADAADGVSATHQLAVLVDGPTNIAVTPALPRSPTLAETIRATMLPPDAYPPDAYPLGDYAPAARTPDAAFIARERIGNPSESACPACGRVMSFNARFCRRCGAPSVAPRPVPPATTVGVRRRTRPRPITVLVGTMLALIASLSFLEIMLGSSPPSPEQDRQPTHYEADRPSLVRAVPDDLVSLEVRL
jgi:cellulose synthase/poly-beta-1,6-N-acetylglucosamine synthase-like glycosyltransferase